MGGLSTGLAPEWLALRETADTAARATALLDPLRAYLPAGRLLIRDVGCGTGAMGRWLAGQLPGPQRWILHDRDPDLLAAALDTPAPADRDGRPVVMTGAPGDLIHLTAADLAGTCLVTASALLDLLTATEVNRLAAACLAAGCAVLCTVSVLGRVRLDPPDPLDPVFEAAFNAHQCRTIAGRTLLGPTAVEVAARAFAAGATVYRHASPWRLGPADPVLIEEWLHGWVSAAVEHNPDLADQSGPYLMRRLEANAAGTLRIEVAHADLLALPEVIR
jgi:hypothetical protein